MAGLFEGGKDATIDFFPSLYWSAHGATQSLWAFVTHPVNATTSFCNTCYDMSKYTVEFCKNLDWNQIEGYSVELRKLCEQFENLTHEDQGHSIGYIIGKYGVDIFAGGATIKGVALLKNLKNANKLCNLEVMASSLANREALVSLASKHALAKENYFKNISIHWDRQNKHIPGKHNYEPEKCRSILTHSDPQKLLSRKAGTGIPKGNMDPGFPGYVERVDFEEIIGYYINEKKPNIKLQTTKGTIKYSKDGAHIVPSHPEG